MPYTSHGHHISNTANDDPPSAKAKCGGIKMCRICRKDVEKYNLTLNLFGAPPFVAEKPPVDFQARAKKVLIDYIYAECDKQPVIELYIKSFTKVLQNWTALMVTNLSDGKYYEVTHNGDKKVTYVDEYRKVKNTAIPD